MDPATNIQRPRSISVTGSGWSWSTGNCQCDGAGNMKQVGASKAFVYDKVSRLTSGIETLKQFIRDHELEGR